MGRKRHKQSVMRWVGDRAGSLNGRRRQLLRKRQMGAVAIAVELALLAALIDIVRMMVAPFAMLRSQIDAERTVVRPA